MENRIEEAISKASQYIIDRDYSSASSILHDELVKKENTLSDSAKLMSYYLLTYYFTCNDIQKFYQQFVDANKNMENFSAIMAAVPSLIIDDLTDFHKKIRFRISYDFYLQTGACSAFIERLNTDENITFETIDNMFSIYEHGKNVIKPADTASFHTAAYQRIVKQINKLDEKTIRNVNEKNLKSELAIIRRTAKSSFCKEIDKFETQISLRYIKSEYLSKQFIGLMHISQLHKLSKELIEKIEQEHIIKFLFKHMHHDLVEPFAHLLARLWYYGHYNTDELTKFWEMTFQQHSSEIANFFTQWQRLYDSIPHDRIGEFWNLITSTKQFPPASYRFLVRISYNCPESVRKSLLDVLWDTRDYEVVYAFLPKMKSEKHSYFYKALDISNVSERFALQVINQLWESGISSYDEIVNHKWTNLNYDLVLRLLLNIAKSSNFITNVQFETTKKLILKEISPQLFKNFISDIKYLLPNEILGGLLAWACDNSLTSDIVMWLYKSFPGSDSDPLWKLIFDHKRNEISAFVVDNALEVETNEAIMNIINKCSAKIGNIGALITLGYLIRKVEDPLDFEALNIHRNQFISPESLIIVNLTGVITKTVKIPSNFNVASFKKYCSNLINSVDAIVLFDNAAISPSHVFANDQSFAIYKKSSTPVRQWTHDELPSVIIRNSPVFSQLFQMMNITNSDLAVNALGLLNLMDTSQSDIDDFQNAIICGDFSKLLDITHPLLLQYRLHHLAKLISENNKNFIETAALPATKSLLNILMDESVRNAQYISMLIRCISLLIKFNQSKTAFIELGAEKGICSLSSWILALMRENNISNLYLTYSLYTFLNEFVAIDPVPLAKLDCLDELFKLAMFSNNFKIANISYIAFSKLPIANLENLIVKNIEQSAHNCSREFFYLLKECADQTENPIKLFSILFETLKKNLLIAKEIKLREDYPEDVTGDITKPLTEQEKENLLSSVKDLTSSLADSYFINGIVDSLSILLQKYEAQNNDELENCLDFLVSNILLNSRRFIEKPYQLSHLVLELTNRTKSSILINDFTKFLTNYDENFAISTQNYYLSENNGPRGLNNLGCTCYLNSAIQMYFRLKEVREAILSYCSNSENFETDEYSQFQLLIAQMFYMPCSYVDPTTFIKTWKGFMNKPIDPIDQQDSSEFLQSLLDKVDDNVSGKSASKSVKGTILHVMKGIGNKFTSESRDDFCLFPLEVKNNKNFEDAFKTFLQPDIITGYNTETDLGNIDIERYNYLEKAPNTLIVQLKRFEFDLMTGDRRKVNSYFEFPLVADFSPLMQTQSIQDTKYILTGIIVHSGSSAGGHYFAYAKEGEKWLCFNDSHVSDVNMRPEEMIKTLFGGNTTREVYDPDYNSMKTETCEKMTSAYVLIYKKIGTFENEIIREPIELMPKRMVKVLVDGISQIIVHDTMSSQEMISLITSLTELDNCSDFIFDYFFKVTNCCDTIRKAIIDKASTEKFAEYILNRDDFLIKTLTTTNNQALRNTTIELINTSILTMKTKAKPFIDKILSRMSEFLANWRTLDDIFAPVLFYIKNINCEDIVSLLLDFVFNVDDHIAATELAEFLKNVRLSRVFDTIAYILEKLKLYQIYRSKIISKNFMDRWFSSDTNAFSFSMLVMSLIKDNNEMNAEYFQYLNSQKDTMQPNVVAAFFATACSFTDTLQKQRLQWFYSFVRSKNWPAISTSTFLTETANRIRNSTSVVCSLVFIPDTWMERWLLNNELFVRSAAEQMLYSLVPKCRPLMRNSQGRVVLPTQPTMISDIERKAFNTIFDALKNLFKTMLTQCYQASGYVVAKRPSENYISAPNYFDALIWTVYYGGLTDRVKKEFGTQIAKAANVLNSLQYNQKAGVIALIHFLHLFEFKMDPNLSGIFINYCSTIPDETAHTYVVFLASELFPILSRSNETFQLLVDSKIFKSALFHALGDYTGSDTSMQHVIESAPIPLADSIATKLWVLETIQFLTENGSGKTFLEVTRYLVSVCDSALDIFAKCGLLQMIATSLSLCLSRADWFKASMYGDVLNTFSVRFTETRKGKTSYFIFNRISPFLEFAKQSTDLVKVLLKAPLDATCPVDLSLQCIDTARLMLTCDEQAVEALLPITLSSITSGGWKRMSIEAATSMSKLLCDVSKMAPNKSIPSRIVASMVNAGFFSTTCAGIILKGSGGLSTDSAPTLYALFEGIIRTSDERYIFVAEFANLMCEVAKICGKIQEMDVWVSCLFSDVKLGAVPMNIVPKVVAAMMKFDNLSQVKTTREITEEQLAKFPESISKCLRQLSHV